MKNLFPKNLGLFLLVVYFSATGCATIMNGDMVGVPVKTHPSEAKLFVHGREYTSPSTVEVPRGEGDFQLQLSKPGFKTGCVKLEESMDIWYAGNLIFGGLIGLILDPLTGDAYDVEPEEVEYWFVKEGEKGGGYLGEQPPDAREETDEENNEWRCS